MRSDSGIRWLYHDHPMVMAAVEENEKIATALKLLAEPGRWGEVWQMRDFAQAVLDGQEPDEAAARVLGALV